MKAEYITLSTCARKLLPPHSILSNIIKHCPIDHDHNNINWQDNISLTTSSHLQSKQNDKLPPLKVYEDTTGCIVLAVEHGQTHPWTKHTGIKYHHFWNQVHLRQIKVMKIATDLNWADIFTKPLVQSKVEALCSMIMGYGDVIPALTLKDRCTIRVNRVSSSRVQGTTRMREWARTEKRAHITLSGNLRTRAGTRTKNDIEWKFSVRTSKKQVWPRIA